MADILINMFIRKQKSSRSSTPIPIPVSGLPEGRLYRQTNRSAYARALSNAYSGSVVQG